MEKLVEGIIQFRRGAFETNRNLFKDLKAGQKPHTLFITCSDSRVDPNLITGTMPGELFTIRNIANIVPPYRITSEYTGTTSAIEYAVEHLEVKNIIVCGHSNCGGCASSLHASEHSDHMPYTTKWLELIHSVRDRVLYEFSDDKPFTREWMMEQANVTEQLNNLMSYPFIQEKVAAKKLTLSGWHYIIETGEVYIYDGNTGEFLLANA